MILADTIRKISADVFGADGNDKEQAENVYPMLLAQIIDKQRMVFFDVFGTDGNKREHTENVFANVFGRHNQKDLSRCFWHR
jgi:hypothetical protein